MAEFIYQIFDEITSDTVRSVATFLRGLPDKAQVVLDMTSYGGEIFPSIAIIQMIQMAQKDGATFTARIWGLAASSAADIALACDRIEMGSTSHIMIHSAWVVDAEGKGKDPGIDAANSAQLAVIQKRLPDYTEKDLRADRWFTAQEALKIGLADSIFDVDLDDVRAAIAAKYITTFIHGERDMKQKAEIEEVKKDEEVIEEKAEEVIEEEKEEVKEEVKEEAPSQAELFEKIADRLDAIEKRLDAIESEKAAPAVEQAACGDDKEQARLKAVYDRIQSITRPAQPKVVKAVQLSPKDELERIKAKYPNLNSIIARDDK